MLQSKLSSTSCYFNTIAVGRPGRRMLEEKLRLTHPLELALSMAINSSFPQISCRWGKNEKIKKHDGGSFTDKIFSI